MYSWQRVGWSLDKYSYSQQTAFSDMKQIVEFLAKFGRMLFFKGSNNNTVLQNGLAGNE